jgi:hypothetical protein
MSVHKDDGSSQRKPHHPDELARITIHGQSIVAISASSPLPAVSKVLGRNITILHLPSLARSRVFLRDLKRGHYWETM